MQSVKSRGRPSDQEKIDLQREKLLNAAHLLLNRYSYKKITIRDIASQAGLNSAMIKYYFNNKEGLFIELLSQLSTKQLFQFRVVEDEKKPLLFFVKYFVEILKSEPGLYRFLTEEVLNQESALAEFFIEQFPKQVSQLLPDLIKKETGIQDDFQANLAAFHLSSVLISPFLLRTVRLKAWKLSDDTLYSDQWVQFIYESFLFGFRKGQHNDMECKK